MSLSDETGKAWNKTVDAASPAVRVAFVNDLVSQVHEANAAVGWWTAKDGTHLLSEPERAGYVVGTKLMLGVSELSEAMEGHRKGLMDDHLPHRPMIEVELADALIRILDLAGALKADLGGAMVEKLAYNAKRQDHKLEVRQASGGKSY